MAILGYLHPQGKISLKRFLVTWEDASSVEDVAHQLGIPPDRVLNVACRLRKRGLYLARLPGGTPVTIVVDGVPHQITLDQLL